MTVTLIEPLNKYKSKVFLDEDFAFVLYKGELRKYQIKEQAEISEELYREIVETVLSKRAKERVLFLLKSSDKTEFELRKKLIDGGYPQSAVDIAIAFVLKHRLIDDHSYAQRYIERFKKKKSKKQISYDLEKKGIHSEITELLFDENQIEEEEQIYHHLVKKKYDPETLDPVQRNKMVMSLGRKGFSYEKIKKVMDNFVEMEF